MEESIKTLTLRMLYNLVMREMNTPKAVVS